MVRRRRAERYRENQKSLEVSDALSPKLEVIKKPEENDPPEPSPMKEANIESIIKCEAGFFCEVLHRLSKEIRCARDLDDLDDVISMATKFLLASAAKEKAIACQLSASTGNCCLCRNASDCDCDFDDSTGKNE